MRILAHNHVDVAIATGHLQSAICERAVSQVARSAREVEDITTGGAHVAEGGTMVEGLKKEHIP